MGSSLAKPAEESYSSDPFEEVSASGSGDKVNNIWTRNKDQGKKLVSSSSDKYDDNDFESMSKSKSDTMTDSKKDSSRSAQNKLNKLAQSKPVEKSILSTYVKKENKGTMTDAGKYDFMNAADT
jgi:hypothetical protein